MNHEQSYTGLPATTHNHTTKHDQSSRRTLLRKPVASDPVPCKLEVSSPWDGEPAGAISAQPGNAIYRFAPPHHQTATVAGLSGPYAAEEIGAIYASSWERDFSQGHADIAIAAVAWAAVKSHAANRNGDPGPAAAIFQAAMWKLVDDDLIDIVRGESLGNLMDVKAHIKDHVVAAIDVYRVLHNANAIGGSIDNWSGAAKPEGYVDLAARRSRTTGSLHTGIAHPLPVNNNTNIASRDPIKEQTAGPAYNAAQWEPVARHLGRAMHAFEDFWVHANWLELAKLTYVRAKLGGNVPPILQGRAVVNQDLETGTLGIPAKVHALGHKLLALARGFQHDFDLMLEVYGRTKASTKLDDDHAKIKRRTASGGHGDSDHAKVYEPLATDSQSTIGDLMDVFLAAHNVQELVRSGKYKVEDFLCNRAWLAALEDKSKILIKQGNDDFDAHGTLAKDHDEESKDHRGRMLIAQAANKLVFGPLRAIMDEKDPAKALAATQKQLSLIDAMIQAPSSSHPLWSYVAAAAEAPMTAARAAMPVNAHGETESEELPRPVGGASRGDCRWPT